MLENLLTEQRNPASSAIDDLPVEEVLRIINKEDRGVAVAVERAIPSIAAAVEAICRRISEGGRLLYIGAGTSGRLGVLDASECPPTYGVAPDLIQGVMAGGMTALYQATEASEDDPEAGVRDVMARGFTGRDALVGIAASGRTPYVIGAVQHARGLGAVTVGISCTPTSPLSLEVEFPIEVLTGPEVVTGSTRMKAGTATKLVLNMISTAAMIRLGHVYGNLMVNVQPRNAKLMDRARRIVAVACGIGAEEAGRLLEAGGSVKTAIVMAKLRVERRQAERILADAGGVIQTALKAASGPE